jgi:hypothetical protein
MYARSEFTSYWNFVTLPVFLYKSLPVGSRIPLCRNDTMFFSTQEIKSIDISM